MGKSFVLFCISWILFAYMNVALSQNVVLKGNVKNFNTEVQILDNSEFAFIGVERPGMSFVPDNQGNFEKKISISKPGYFRIGRNILYLSPGDSLTMKIDYRYADSASFTGKGAEANNYLKTTTFPKAGSFLKGGDEIKSTYQATIDNILYLSERRRKELSACRNVSTQFRNLENARIRADILNSIFDIRAYYGDNLSGDSLAKFKKSYAQHAPSLISKYSMGFVNAEYLKLEVYREIIPRLRESNFEDAKNIVELKKIDEWESATAISYLLSTSSEKDSIKIIKDRIMGVRNESYRKRLLELYNSRLAFGNGDPAINIHAVDEYGKDVSLDKYKGSIIYIDVWATWCGPCLAEIPSLTLLKEKYAGRNIVFISLSIDNNLDDWRSDLRERNLTGLQWVIDRSRLSDYRVITVPRTIIIDSNYILYDMYAPNPSSKKTEPLINDLLSR